MVEVSAFEGNEKGLKAFGAEEEVQIVTPPAPSSLGSIFMNTLLDSSAHYERLKKKKTRFDCHNPHNPGASIFLRSPKSSQKYEVFL